MSRVLVVHPGSQFSTGDVYHGIVGGLRSLGVEVGAYALTDRIAAASEWVALLQRRARRHDPSRPLMDRDERLNRIFDEASKDVLAMALDNRVDGVLVISGMFLPGQTLYRLRRAGVPVGLLLTECPYDDDRHEKLAPLVDIVWANERASVARLRAVQPQTYYLAAAYDSERHRDVAPDDAPDVAHHDVVFVGTAFRERLDLLAAVDWSGLDLGLYGNFTAGVGGHRATARCRRLLDPYVRGGLVTNETTAELYRRAAIGLNLYRTSILFDGKTHVVGAESLNPRAYELAATGCFQISDWRAEVGDVFGDSVPTFDDAADLGAMVRYYLAHPAERQARAREAQRRVAGHSFTHRARQMVADWPDVLAPASALAAYG
ncbi:MAG: glycosyltransferase [Rhodospirillaceae bacterium]